MRHSLIPYILLKIFLPKAGILCHRAPPQPLPKVSQPCSLQVSVRCSPLSGPSRNCGQDSGSTEVAISKPPGYAHHVARAEWRGGDRRL